jgi:glycosyltransferase involved in cell wall biosynthesis
MREKRPIRVLLTVPHLNSAAAPYRDMMAIAKYLPQGEFDLTICSVGRKGYEKTKPILQELGRECKMLRLRPTRTSLQEYLASYRSQIIIENRGPFQIQHSIMGTSSPYEAFIGKMRSRFHVHSQIDMTDGGHPILFRAKLHLATKIIAVSESVKKYVISRGASPSKVRTVYNGLDLEEFDKDLLGFRSRRKRVILCAGLVVRRKRQEDAIKALSFLSEDMPDARLWIAGRITEKDYLEELKGLALELGVSDRVEFLGLREDLVELMQEASVLIHCADSEGLPWVILEAMALGLPVVGSGIEPIKEIIDNGANGFIVPPNEPLEYAKALGQILQQPILSEKLTKNARSTVENRFSASTMVAQIAEIYRELVA